MSFTLSSPRFLVFSSVIFLYACQEIMVFMDGWHIVSQVDKILDDWIQNVVVNKLHFLEVKYWMGL